MRDAEAMVFSYRQVLDIAISCTRVSTFLYRKEIQEGDARLRQQVNMYQAARNDRTSLSRALTEAKDQAADLKVALLKKLHLYLINHYCRGN